MVKNLSDPARPFSMVVQFLHFSMVEVNVGVTFNAPIRLIEKSKYRILERIKTILV